MDSTAPNNICRLLLLLLVPLASTIQNAAHAWVTTAPARTTLAVTPRKPPSAWRTSCFMSAEENESKSESETTESSKEEEIEKLEQELKIARLEAELKKLKDDKSEEAPPPPRANPIVVVEKEEKKEEDYDEIIPLEDASMDMFVSEGWKQAREGYDPKNTKTVTRKTEEQNSAFGLIATVVGGLLAVVLFSQIPIGQEDLSKYSNIKSQAPVTSIDLGDMNRVKGQKGNYEVDDSDDS